MKKKLMWGFNFFVLTLFSAFALTSFFGGSTSKAYAETLSHNNFYKKGKHFMVVDRHGRFKGSHHGKQEICALTTEQVAELDAFFKVKQFELEIKGEAVLIAAVSGKHLTKKQLMDYLKASDHDLKCKIIHHHRIFFFPVLPQVS